MQRDKEPMIHPKDITTIAEMWKFYERMNIPPEAGEAQRICLKDAFYAGAAAMFTMHQGLAQRGC
jgi:hypothetical protein